MVGLHRIECNASRTSELIQFKKPVEQISARRSHLLNTCNMTCDVFYRDWVLDGQPMRLALHASAINQDSGVGSQSYRSGTDQQTVDS